MNKIVEGKANLSSREIDKIESLTRLTAGQLAVSVTEPEGGPLTELFRSTAVLLKLERALEAKERETPNRQRSKWRSKKPAFSQPVSSRRPGASTPKRPSRARMLAVA